MSWEQQNLPDNLKRFHFTVVGGFAHGTRIPESNGLRSIQTVPLVGWSPTYGFAHVSHRFVIHATGGMLVVFAPYNLDAGYVQGFVSGQLNEQCLKSFSVSCGRFIESGK